MRQYVGARYVPMIFQNPDDSTNNWKQGVAYEPLTIVSYAGASYTSKRDVPASIGNPASNPDYWVAIGLYSGQTSANTTAIERIKESLSNSMENTNTASQNYSIGDILWFDGYLCKVTSPITAGDILSLLTNLEKETLYPLTLDDIITPADFPQKEYFRNKRIMICGDSISDEGTYPPNWVAHFRNFVADVNATVINKSVSGITLTGANGIAEALPTYTESDIDIIILEAGTNDCNIQALIGNSESTSTNTVIGAMKEMGTVIGNKWPNAQVFFVIPPKCALTESTTPAIAPTLVPRCMYRCAIALWCNNNNWNIIDASCGMPQFNLNNNNLKVLYSDGIHPNTVYAPIMMKYIVQQIISGGSTTIGYTRTKVNYSSYMNSDVVSDGYCEINFESTGLIRIIALGNCIVTSGSASWLTGLPPVLMDMFPQEYTPYGFVLGSELRIVIIGSDTITVQQNSGTNGKIDVTLDMKQFLGFNTAVSQ